MTKELTIKLDGSDKTDFELEENGSISIYQHCEGGILGSVKLSTKEIESLKKFINNN